MSRVRLPPPRPFFCLYSKAKKHEAVRLRFMHRRCASYILMLDEQSSQAQNVLHTAQPCFIKAPFQTWHGVAKRRRLKHCFRLHFITPRQAARVPQYEAAPVFISLRRGKPFHSTMKHSAYAPYDARKWEIRVYPFAIQRYPHYIMTCNPVLYGWIFLSWFYPMNDRHL